MQQQKHPTPCICTEACSSNASLQIGSTIASINRPASMAMVTAAMWCQRGGAYAWGCPVRKVLCPCVAAMWCQRGGGVCLGLSGEEGASTCQRSRPVCRPGMIVVGGIACGSWYAFLESKLRVLVCPPDCRHRFLDISGRCCMNVLVGLAPSLTGSLVQRGAATD